MIKLPGVAQAEEEDTPAKKYFKEGKAHYEKEEYDKAYDSFLESFGLSGEAELLINMAKCKEKRDKPNYRDAISLYEQYLSLRPTAPDKEEIQRKIDVLRGYLAPSKEPERKSEEPKKTDKDDDDDGDAKSGSSPPSPALPPPPPKKTRILSPLLLITGGLAVVAGGIALAVANGMEQDLIKNCMSRCLPERYSTVNDQRLGGGLAIGGGAVFVGLGFVALGYGR